MKPQLILSFLLSLAWLSPLQADDCAPTNIDGWTQASYALSGDRIIVNNKTLKLIGLHAPQQEKKQKFNVNAQPLAEAAQDRLNRLLANHDMEVGIEYDQRRVDEFGAAEAHVFIRQNGQIVSLQKAMLETGFALAKTETPNLAHQSCYYRAEQSARQRGAGLWQLAEQRPELRFPIAPSSEITTANEGFHIFKGEIVKVDRSGKNYILNMDTTGLRIRKKDWSHFDFDRLKALEGQVVEARGYGFLYDGAMFVKIHAPYAIDKLNPALD
ncbi:thermonuclease family protein [Hydrogenovibrio halophilus]|uniref:thermonuclease family protein n=1 Tax=Hydrogenovibrio halophilus TaxID=373391 RepID=UPI000368AC50|nr:thermonuclease family protein [Hydrogenovibrio halophilus]